jgi:hypothetical protein
MRFKVQVFSDHSTKISASRGCEAGSVDCASIVDQGIRETKPEEECF